MAYDVLSKAVSASAAFTPAAASHTAGDVNGAAATFAFGADAPLAGPTSFMIMSASLLIADATVKATAWRLHLYTVTPPSALADDAPWDIASGDRTSYLGYVDLGTAVDVGATQYVEVNGINKVIKTATGSVFGYLSNLSTITPAAAAHTVTLNAVTL